MEGTCCTVHCHHHVVLRIASTANGIVAHCEPEVVGARYRRKHFPSWCGVGDHSAQDREVTLVARSGKKWSEARAASIGGNWWLGSHGVVHLLPTVREYITAVGIGTGAREQERCAARDHAIHACIGSWRRVHQCRHRIARVASTSDEGVDLAKAVSTIHGVAIVGDVRRANASVAHDRDATAHFHRRSGRAVAVAVLRVVAAELVAHFVRHIIDIEWIAHRRT